MTTKKDDFVHTHVHTDFSMLDGHGMIKDLVDEVVRLGQRAIAITDHGNMHGAHELYTAAKKADLIPIIGMEAYAAPGASSRKDRSPVFFGNTRGNTREEGSMDVSAGGAYTHLTMLAETTEGMHNLFRLSTFSYTEGYFKKPRIDTELLSQYSKGIIATTGCPSGEVQTRLRLGQYDEARSYASQMQDILGRDNYFMELMEHGMTSNLERGVRGDLLRLAKELNLPLLATNDLHYVHKEDAKSHEELLAMQTGGLMSEPPDSQGGKRFAFEGDSYFVKSGAQMRDLFGDLPESLSNTMWIAERAQGVTFTEDDASLRPSIEIPDGYTADEWIRKVAYEGLEKRYGKENITQFHIDRMETELNVIIPKNYVMYFLVVADFVRWAKQNGVAVGFGRGSVGGSLIAFCMDITELDPIRHKLLFERFLNPERDSPPDIDMDFDDKHRDDVIQYVTGKYGKERVAMVVTFGRIKARNAMRDSARILELPYSLANKLSKAFPADVMGKGMSLTQVYDPANERYDEANDFRQLVEKENADELVKTARGVEGRCRQTGVHAAGIIIGAKPILDTVPMMMRQKDGAMITQFDYPTSEGLGLLKVDFLGLRNLSIIADAIKNIKTTKNLDLKIEDIIHGPMDDPKTYDLLQKGETLGVFQLDGGPMRDLLRRLRPTTFDDVSAVIALYRPGPMGVNAHNDYADRKNGRKPIEPIHPELEKALEVVLGDTYGLVVYQEQVMQAAQYLAGYSLAQADMLRRAMGKKKRYILEAEFVGFEAGMIKNGFSKESIKTLWDVLVPFADYAFNKSHSAGYGLLSYLTAYLKANYASEYMAALLTSTTDDPATTAIYLHECRRMGMKVSSPSVSRSLVDYAPVSDNEIIVGLSAIRGMGENSSASLIAARDGKPFTTLTDFLNKAPLDTLNKRVLEGLIDSGAFDEFGNTRRALATCLVDIAHSYSTLKKKEEKGQDSLFAMMEDMGEEDISAPMVIPYLAEFSKRDKLSRERHVLGLYVSDHPLSGMENSLTAHSNATIIDILGGTIPVVDGFIGKGVKKTKIAGIISSITRKRTKNGEMFAILIIEDMTGTIEAPLYPSLYTEFNEKLFTDRIYTFTGVPRRREEEDPITFMVDDLIEIEATPSGKIPVWFKLANEQCTPEGIAALQKILLRHPGETSVCLSIKTDGAISSMELSEQYSVSTSPHFVSEVQELFGFGCIGRWRK